MNWKHRLVVFVALPALITLLLFVGFVLVTVPAETAPGPCECVPF